MNAQDTKSANEQKGNPKKTPSILVPNFGQRPKKVDTFEGIPVTSEEFMPLSSLPVLARAAVTRSWPSSRLALPSACDPREYCHSISRTETYCDGRNPFAASKKPGLKPC